MKNIEAERQINTLLSGLKNGIGKSNFVGTMIQMIGICKINKFEREEIVQLFQRALFEAEFDEKQNHDYLAVFINQLNNGRINDFELDKLEQVMFGLIQTSVVPVAKVEETVREIPREVPREVPREIPEEIDYEAIALADEEEYALYEEAQADETGVLDGSFWESRRAMAMAENLQAGFGSTGRPGQVQVRVAYLIRENSGEEIPLTKEIFSIGKDGASVDYGISGNTTVSRRHAEIIKRGRHYFICDKGSTNKTYVEGKEIRPEEFVEIHNGTRIKISNEEFTFYL